MYLGSFVSLSFATTSRKDGPENLRWRRDEPELPSVGFAGVSASVLSLFGKLVGREEESDDEVSSLRSDGKRVEVDILFTVFRDGGRSSFASLDLLPSRKGVRKDPLTMTAERQRGKRQGPAMVQDNRRRGQGRAADAGHLHKVRLPSDWPSSPQPPSRIFSDLRRATMTTLHLVRRHWCGVF